MSPLRPRLYVALILLLAALPSTATAAGADFCDWGRVRQLRAGQSISIRTGGPSVLSGLLVRADDTMVTLIVDGAPRQIARTEVGELRARRTRRGIAGIVLAAAGGALIVGNATSRNPEAGPGPMWFAGAPVALAGALVIHRERSRTGLIYRRP